MQQDSAELFFFEFSTKTISGLCYNLLTLVYPYLRSFAPTYVRLLLLTFICPYWRLLPHTDVRLPLLTLVSPTDVCFPLLTFVCPY